jgi:hypothetical protein
MGTTGARRWIDTRSNKYDEIFAANLFCFLDVPARVAECLAVSTTCLA